MVEPNEPLTGMTLNERLFARGLYDRFDEALAARNANALRTILAEVEVSDVAWTIDQLLNTRPAAD